MGDWVPRGYDVERFTASTQITIAATASGSTNNGVFLLSDAKVGVHQELAMGIWASILNSFTGTVSFAASAAGRWHDADISTDTVLSRFSNGYANGHLFASGAGSATASGSQIVYFPATAATYPLSIHPNNMAYRVNFSFTNTAAAARTISIDFFAVVMGQGR